MDILFAIRIFQRVATTRSFTGTGELLGIATSSVSRQIDTLEEFLGVKLLNRSTRKLSLTEAGQVYKEQVDGILADLDEMNENIASLGDELRGRLKVSAPRVFGKRLLAPSLTGFLKTHPKLKVELCLTDNYVDLVETDTDLAIRIGSLDDSGLVSRPLGRYRRVLCCHPSYLSGRETPLLPADLARHNCLRYRRSGERVVWTFCHPENGETFEFAPQGDLVANDVEILLSAASDGLGIAMLPHWLVRDAFAQGELIPVLADYPIASSLQETGIHFVYAINRRQSRKVHVYMEYVLGKAGPLLI